MDWLFGLLSVIHAFLAYLFLSYTEQRFANSPPKDMDWLFDLLRVIHAFLVYLFLFYAQQRFANSPPKDMAGGASSSSSSSSSSHVFGPLNRGKYEVFISFRGKDTRRNFICFLRAALKRRKIKLFIDNDLRKGDEITPSLRRAIEESYVSVVVFSKNYADSQFCLEELVKIMECRRDHGQVVIPVFYEIDPSHVANQSGSYKEALEEHKKNSKVETHKIRKWTDALIEACRLAACSSDSRSCRDDNEIIQKIVEDVLEKLDTIYPPDAELVGISRNHTPVEWMLEKVQSVGICGTDGIGKTTIAREILGKYSHEYEGSYLLENVHKRSGQHWEGLQRLRDELHSNLLWPEVCQASSSFIEKKLRNRTSFIVLDDVSSLEQLKYLVGELQYFGLGNKIIITSRDMSVLRNAGVSRIHIMKVLEHEESLKLFSLKAFNEECPKIGYEERSQRAIVHCNGIPLALKVLGSFLKSKSEIEWDSALEKLENNPNKEIQKVLRLSYDGLSEEEKQTFLHIACCPNGEQTEHAIGISSLFDKALINISHGHVWMHHSIQEMGREIDRQESINNPGRHSLLGDESFVGF